MKALLFLSVLVLSGCASGLQRLRKVDPGMNAKDVEIVMGKRDSFSSAESGGHNYTLHKYTNRLCNGHVSLSEKCDFYIVYRDGEVIETGVSDIRELPSNMQFMYLFHGN